ncbi:hypothetical protein KIN20_025042 [Parelaphostrongylus tenuis]|uniref:Uncharacterized protein n=1 Tax=Parelaphostrongylus tenuis TaxID=148309 RepID=A0AAD5QX38_PARTN|nr:hypothetical protein KIN20_025042 [Parelaphostrongylus tenuis]
MTVEQYDLSALIRQYWLVVHETYKTFQILEAKILKQWRLFHFAILLTRMAEGIWYLPCDKFVMRTLQTVH